MSDWVAQLLEHPSIASLPYAVGCAVVLLLGGVILLRERASPAGRIYAIYTASVGLWMAGNYLVFNAPSFYWVEQFARIANIGISLIPAALFHVCVLAVDKLRLYASRVYMVWLTGLAMAGVILFSDWFFAGTHQLGLGGYPAMQPMGFIWFGYIWVVIIMALLLLYRTARRAPQGCARRARARWLLAATMVGNLAGLDALATLGFDFPPYAVLFLVITIAMTTYVAWRYRLIDITARFAAPHVLATMREALVVMDEEHMVRLVNRAAKQMFSPDGREMKGREWEKVVRDAKFARDVVDVVHARNQSGGELLLRGVDGITHMLSLSTSTIDDALGKPLAHICVFTDVSERYAAETHREALIGRLESTLAQLQSANEQLHHLSNVDSLTGAANRRRFEEMLRSSCDHAGETGEQLTLIIIDLDNFKEINDRFGHPAGDECLIHLVNLCEEVATRPHDVVARIGGEEFALIMPDTPREGGVRVAERVRGLVETSPVASHGEPIRLTVSIGVVSTDNATAAVPEKLIQAADEALYRAKQQGRNRVCAAEAGAE